MWAHVGQRTASGDGPHVPPHLRRSLRCSPEYYARLHRTQLLRNSLASILLPSFFFLKGQGLQIYAQLGLASEIPKSELHACKAIGLPTGHLLST